MTLLHVKIISRDVDTFMYSVPPVLKQKYDSIVCSNVNLFYPLTKGNYNLQHCSPPLPLLP